MRWLVVLVISIGVLGANGVAVTGAETRSGSVAGSADLVVAVRGFEHQLFVFVESFDGSHPGVLIGEGTDPAWSPDGSRLAFSSNSYTDDGLSPEEIYVAKADGSSLTRLTFDAAAGLAAGVAAKSAPTWSPDGASIAYLFKGIAGADVWTVPVAGGAAHRLTRSGGGKVGLAWSPTGGSLLTTQNHAVVVLNPTTGVATALAQGSEPAWSPDGRKIAYVDRRPDGRGRVAVMNADGSSSQELTTVYSHSPAWSPDGTEIAFTGDIAVRDPYGGDATGVYLYTAPADGSAPPRRLTGPFESPNQPEFSPDGAYILHHVDLPPGGLMNVDGSCDHGVPALAGPVAAGPFWRPHSVTGGPTSCVDLVAHADIDPGPVALGQPAAVKVTVENHGNLPAHDVVLKVAPANAESDVQGCRSRDTPGAGCLLGTLAPGGSQVAYLSVSSTSGSRSPLSRGLSFSVTSTDTELTPEDNAGSAWTTVLPCTLVGTTGPDHLQGTPHPDRICGLGGRDWINGGSGNDYLDGGPGKDTFIGGSGRDVIAARDGERDSIDCGPGYDVAVVDELDHVRNCERVLRK